jgi:vacuolar-type H+-ATPase subunit I/STV1
MKLATIDKLVWALIYLGMVVAGVGLALLRSEVFVLGWSVLGGGAALAAVGVVLIVIRSRMKELSS